MPKYQVNVEKNGIEIFFDDKPDEKVRDEMKKVGFRWHSVWKILVCQKE